VKRRLVKSWKVWVRVRVGVRVRGNVLWRMYSLYRVSSIAQFNTCNVIADPRTKGQ